MTRIELPSRSVRDYLAQSGVAAIWVTSSCRIGAGRDLSRVGPIAAVWRARDRSAADQVIMTLGEQRFETVKQATTGTILSEHVTVLQRAGAAVLGLDLRLGAAQRAGALRTFNSEYTRRRLRARAAGQRFMLYSEARRRLRQVLASAAAGRSVSELMRAVFDAPAKP